MDRDLWSSFKEYASKSGVEVGKMLEELIRDSLIEAELDKALVKMDFNLVEPISTLVRIMRDERADRVFRLQRDHEKVRKGSLFAIFLPF